LVLDFYNQRRRQLLNSKPNAGHYALAELEKYFEVQIITQNIDNLHERAGSTKVVHLHGELMKVRSTGPGEEVFDVDPKHPDVNLGDKCPKGYQLRPHIVWFGEAVPEIQRAEHMTYEADIFLIIGTSLVVYPAAGLIHNVKAGVPVYLIDPKEVNAISLNVTFIQKGASEGMKEFKRLLSLD
jgi:NAD-dependent deacetylase